MCIYITKNDTIILEKSDIMNQKIESLFQNKENNLTQEQLTEKLNISKNVVGKWK